MRIDTVRKYTSPVPRYTSYPTALKFADAVQDDQHGAWLGALKPDEPVSLYLHIPFCKLLCWYCACNTQGTQRQEPVERYLTDLFKEIELVSAALHHQPPIKSMHWGGGSPNSLTPSNMRALSSWLKRKFNFQESASFAVEIDPRCFDEGQAEALGDIGVTRVSLGVQDFASNVQSAIGRMQSFEDTLNAANLIRKHGIENLNIDLVYGLPHQTRTSADATIDAVLDLKPNRIALFGYAHLPSKFSRQRLIDSEALPKVEQRFALANRMINRLKNAGYVRVGLDHLALPDDALARGPIRRNFQGYTSESAAAIVGLGASSISQFPWGYSQNTPSLKAYTGRIEAGRLATVKGYHMNEDDRVRAFTIERLMSDLNFSENCLRQNFGALAEPVIEDAQTLLAADQDGLLEKSQNGFHVTERGRPFLRAICACFDAYLPEDGTQHSVGV